MRAVPGRLRVHACWRRIALVLAAACCWGWSASRAAAQGAAPLAPSRQVPTRTYFVNFLSLYEGDYSDSLRGFLAEGRGAIKTAQARWIDSICYHAQTGECYYQLGQHAQALQHYTSAVELYLAYSDWMVRVQFPPTLAPAQQGAVRACPWGASTRLARLGRFPDTMSIAQGRINNNDVVQQGGVVQQPVLFPINVQEIVRCTTLAIRRRAELLGPAGPHDRLNNELVSALSRRPCPPNHWSECWVDVQLGAAYAATGRDAQALTAFERALVAAGEFDHPLTGMALFELGRMSLAAGDFASAEQLFLEGSYSAYQWGDFTLLEECLRFGLLTHLVANRGGIYPPLETALVWAQRQDLRTLEVSLQALIAENLCALGQPDQALAVLQQARGTSGRRDILRAKLGARLNFGTAEAYYQKGQVEDGDAALNAAIAFQQNGSVWLFQIGLCDGLYTDNSVTDRVAQQLYDVVLRDPSTADWATSPLESLSKLAVPHSLAYEHWFEVAIARKEPERAIEVADLARRHRFFSTLQFGGRLHALRWLLHAPAPLLDPQALLQRQDLLIKYPAYADLTQQADALQDALQQSPLVPADEVGAEQQSAALAELARLSTAQELLLRQMAVRRDPADILFPKYRPTKDVQARLAEGQGLLVFFSARDVLYGFLLTREQYAVWRVGSPQVIEKQLVALYRELGQFNANRQLSLEDLQSTQWQEPAGAILETLLQGSKVSLPGSLSELIVVPDGVLWHVPFELLPADGDSPAPLVSRVKIRYAPTVGVAVGDDLPRRRMQHGGVVLGRLTQQGDPQLPADTLAALDRSLSGLAALPERLPATSSLVGSILDRLFVLTEIPPEDGGPYSWAPLQFDRGVAGSTLGDWQSLPFGGPEVVILPAYHTAAETGFRESSGAAVGQEVFLSVMGMMSTGARTILLSRWRTGGQASLDLVREFAQDLPHTTASDAWQRSIALLRQAQLDPNLEPRVKAGPQDEPPLADSPFFWSGFLLVDTGTQPPSDEQNAEPADELAPENVVPADAVPPEAVPADAPGELQEPDEAADQDEAASPLSDESVPQ